MEDKFRITSERHPRPQSGGSEAVVERNPGVEWGSASLALGAVFAVMAPAALILAHFLESTGYHGFSRTDRRLAALGGYGAAFLILLLVMAGVLFGVRGIGESRRRGRPVALGLAGVMLNGLDLLLWTGAALAWHSSAWNML